MLKQRDDVLYRFQTLYIWFSGFPLACELLKKLARSEVNHCNIDEVRTQFGKEQGLDCWGKKL